MLGNLICAMVTPFDDNNEVDYECVLMLVKKIEENKNTAIVVGGSTGEGHSLSIKEKVELLSYVKKHTKLKIIYAISHNNLDLIKEEIETVKDYNPDCYLITVPFYSLPPQRGIYLFFKEIALISNKPIIIYNVPSRIGTSIDFMTLRKLIKSCPNIIGIKEASSDINLISLLKKNFPKFICYIGNDEHYYEALKAGADGIISVMSVLYGKEMQELYNNFKEGYHHLLLDDYLKLVSKLLKLETNPLPIKYLLKKEGFPSMNLRLPLVELSLEYQHQIDMLL